MKKTHIALLAFVGTLLLLCCSIDALANTAPLKSDKKTVILSVPSMTCAVCPITVKKSLEEVKGVDKALIAFKSKTATVTFDPKKTTIKALKKATKDVGYPSSLQKITVHEKTGDK